MSENSSLNSLENFVELEFIWSWSQTRKVCSSQIFGRLNNTANMTSRAKHFAVPHLVGLSVWCLSSTWPSDSGEALKGDYQHDVNAGRECWGDEDREFRIKFQAFIFHYFIHLQLLADSQHETWCVVKLWPSLFKVLAKDRQSTENPVVQQLDRLIDTQRDEKKAVGRQRFWHQKGNDA